MTLYLKIINRLNEFVWARKALNLIFVGIITKVAFKISIKLCFLLGIDLVFNILNNNNIYSCISGL